MPDITMCSGDGCPKKNRCYRHTAEPTPHWQSYFVKPPFNKKAASCEYFWEVGESTVKITKKPASRSGE